MDPWISKKGKLIWGWNWGQKNLLRCLLNFEWWIEFR